MYRREWNGWWAASADAPGFSAAADSFEDVRQLARDGLVFHFGEDVNVHEITEDSPAIAESITRYFDLLHDRSRRNGPMGQALFERIALFGPAATVPLLEALDKPLDALGASRLQELLSRVAVGAPDHLLTAVRSRSIGVVARISALDVLVFLEKGACLADVLPLLSDSSEHASVREAIAGMLWNLPGPGVVEALQMAASQDPDEYVRRTALESLNLLVSLQTNVSPTGDCK